MRAVRLRKPDEPAAPRVRERPDPIPGPGDGLRRVLGRLERGQLKPFIRPGSDVENSGRGREHLESRPQIAGAVIQTRD